MPDDTGQVTHEYVTSIRQRLVQLAKTVIEGKAKAERAIWN